MAKKCDVCGAPIGFLEKNKIHYQKDPQIINLLLCRECAGGLNSLSIGDNRKNKWEFLHFYLGNIKSWKFKFPESNNPSLIEPKINAAEEKLPKIQHPYVKQQFENRIQWLKELLILDDNLINLFEGELKEIYLKPLYEICDVLKSCNDRLFSMGISNDSLYYSTFTPFEGRIELEWENDRHAFFDKILDHNNPNLDVEAVSNEIIQGIRSKNITPHNWLEEGFHSNEKIPYKLIKIPLDNIIYFSKDGTLEHVSVVSGGGGSGGGVNLGGAIAGGLLFGGVGAIIGSQVDTEIKIDPIKTEIKKEDTRRAFLLYKDDSGSLIQQSFSHEYYDFFMKHFPHKEFSKVQFENLQTSNPTTEAPKTTSETSNIENIKKYKELLDMGIITQEEFDAKKKQLLGL